MNILLDCERMKYPNTGLYHLCLQLGKALQEEAHDDNMYFYTPASVKGCFGNAAHYVTQRSLDKFMLPSIKGLDVWHCNFQGSNYYPFRKKVKKVFTVHDINFMYDDNLSPEKKEKYRLRIKEKVDNSDHITTISRFGLDEVKRVIGIGNKPATVVYCGCNFDKVITGAPPAYQPRSPFLLTIGTIVDKKNMHVLPALLKNNDYELVIAGITLSESYKQKIIAEATRWDVLNRVIFTGAISESNKQWYMEHCKAFVFPSLAEGFGLPVVEAMYFGKPLLISPLSSLPEVGGDVAYYFTDFEPEHMQQVLADSLQHYADTKPMEAIKARAKSFSWQAAARQLLGVYHSLR